MEDCSDTITTCFSSSNTRTSYSNPKSTQKIKNSRNVFEVFSYETRSKTREAEELEDAEESRGVKVVDGSTGLQQGVIIVHKSHSDIVNVEKAMTSNVSGFLATAPNAISRNTKCTTILEKGSDGNGYVLTEKDAEDPLPIDGPYNWPFKIPSAPAKSVKRSFNDSSSTTPENTPYASSPSGGGEEPGAAKKPRIASSSSTNAVSDDINDADIVVIGETRAATSQVPKGRERLKETQLAYWRRIRRERGESNIFLPIVKLVRFPNKQSTTSTATKDTEKDQRKNIPGIIRNKTAMTGKAASAQTAVNSTTLLDSKIECSSNMNKDDDSDDDIVYLKTTVQTINVDARTSLLDIDNNNNNNNNSNADTGGEGVVEVSRDGNSGKIQEYGESVSAAGFICRKFKCGDVRTVSENDVSGDENDGDVHSDVDGVGDDDNYIDYDSDGDDGSGTGSEEDEQEDDDDLSLLAEELFEPTPHQLSKAFQERYHRALDDEDGRGDFFYDTGEDFTLSGAEDFEDADADEIEELEESAKWSFSDELQKDIGNRDVFAFGRNQNSLLKQTIVALPADSSDKAAIASVIEESVIQGIGEHSEQENEYESTSMQDQEKYVNSAKPVVSFGDTERKCEEVEQLETTISREPSNPSNEIRNRKEIDHNNSVTSLAECVNIKRTDDTGMPTAGSYDSDNSGPSGFLESPMGVSKNPEKPVDSHVTPQGPVSMCSGSTANITKGASPRPRMTRPHVTTVAFSPDPDRAYCRVSWDTGPGVLIPLQSLFRVNLQCIPFVRNSGLHALSIPHDIASITEVANTATTNVYNRPICQTKIFSFKDSTGSASTHDQTSTNDNHDDNSARRIEPVQDEDDNNEMGGKSEGPGMSHYDETSLPRDESFGCSSGGRTSNDQNREENTKKMMDVYCVGFDDDNNSDDDDDDDDDDCIIIDTGLGELKVNEPDMIQKEPNCVSQESVDNEVRNEHKFTADCSTTSENNEAQTSPQTLSEELNSDTVRCTGESESLSIETNADSSDSSPTSCLVPEKTGSKPCFVHAIKEQKPLDFAVCSVIDITEDLRIEASVVEGSHEGNSSEEADRENHSRNTDAFDAGLFLPVKEVWGKDIKAEVLDGTCAYSDGLCDILDTSLFDNNYKTSCDSTILDLLTNQTEDDANRPIKNNHLPTSHVASSGCSCTRTAEQAVSSASHTTQVLSVVDVIHPSEFSLATPVQVDLSTAQ